MRARCKRAIETLFLALLLSESVSTRSEGQIREPPIKDCDAICKQISPRSQGKISLLSGAKDGYYFKVGESISAALGSGPNPLKVEVVPTSQTRCNLYGLQTGCTDLALVQSDIAHDAWYGHPPISNSPLGHIALVSQLYVETVHILVRPHLSLGRLADLRGRRVWLGSKDSFTVYSARRILDAAGLTTGEINALENQSCPPSAMNNECKTVMDLNRDAAMTALGKLELDALFQVGAIPYDPVRDLLSKDREIQIFNLDVDLVERLVKDGSYIEQLIPKHTYRHDKGSLTVGVRALLLTSRDAGDPAITKLADALFKNPEAIENELQERVRAEQRIHNDPVTGDPSKLGLLRLDPPGALLQRQLHHHKYSHPWLKKLAPWLALGLLLFFVLYRFRRVIGPQVIKRGELAVGPIGILLVWIVHSGVMHYFEGNINEEYGTLPDAMLGTIRGFFNLTQPVTIVGQQWESYGRAAAVAIFGTMLVPSIRRSLWPRLRRRVKAWLLGMDQKPQGGLSPSERGHSVIINRSPRTEELIRSLQAAGGARDKPIFVLSERRQEFPSQPEYTGVKAVQGDPTSEEFLRKLHLSEARSVTILSAWPPPDPNDRRKYLRGDLADARTIQALRALRSCCRRAGPIEVVAELKSRKNRPAAQEAALGIPIRVICEEDSPASRLTKTPVA